MKPALLLLGFLMAGAAEAQMYKCVDARGRTQYADKPCVDAKGVEVDIRGQRPISGNLQERKDNFGQQERDFQRRQIERGREADAATLRAAQQKQRCAQLRSQLDTLTRVNRISRVNEKGERVYMDDATRDARIAQLNAEIARCQG